LRTCDDTVFAHRSRPCLLHQIGRCSAPCVEKIDVETYRHDVEQAAQFLAGKDDVVTEEITKLMDSAAERQEYEVAAGHRDRIRMLQRVRSGQAVDTAKGGDVDIVVAVEREGVWAVTLAMVRGGRHLGDRTFFPSNANGLNANEVLEAFMEQHYVTQPAPAKIVI